MKIYFPENELPEKARLDRKLRAPIIMLALTKALFGRNVLGVNDKICEFYSGNKSYKKIDLFNIKLKMVYYRFAYEFMYEEFISYGFETKSRKECLEYISSYERIRLYNELYVDKNEWEIFADKSKTYKTFSNFFKRDIVLVNSLQDLPQFSEFINRNRKFIVKPIKENNGNGIYIVDLDKSKKNGIEEFKRCVSLGGVIVEEFIKQDDSLNEIYSGCVNTVRLITYYNQGQCTYIAGILRMGVGGSIIDNASKGGISAGIDLLTGRVRTFGHKECYTGVFEAHPDSGVKIKGFQLPEWNKLLQIVEKLVTICPQKKYVGWDFAYGNKGWVLVEANGGPGVLAVQMSNEKGLRKVFAETVFKDSKYFKEFKSAKY